MQCPSCSHTTVRTVHKQPFKFRDLFIAAENILSFVFKLGIRSYVSCACIQMFIKCEYVHVMIQFTISNISPVLCEFEAL